MNLGRIRGLKDLKSFIHCNGSYFGDTNSTMVWYLWRILPIKWVQMSGADEDAH